MHSISLSFIINQPKSNLILPILNLLIFLLPPINIKIIMTGIGAVINGNENSDLSTCNQIDNTNDCDRFENRLPWHQFDWKSYIAKDLKSIHRYRIYGFKLYFTFNLLNS